MVAYTVTNSVFCMCVNVHMFWKITITTVSIYCGLLCVTHNTWGRKWQPIPVFLPGKSHGRRNLVGCSLVQFSCSVVSDSLESHGPQHARPPCPSPAPGVYSNSSPSSWWCHPTISSSVVPLSSCLQSLPASGYFPVSQLFTSGGQSIGSFSVNISPSNEYPGLTSFSMDWLDLLAVQWTLKSLLQHHSSKASILRCSTFFIVQLSHPYMTTGKTIALTRWTFVDKVMSLLFSMLSRLVITFLPRSKYLLISWLQSPSAVHGVAKSWTWLSEHRSVFNPVGNLESWVLLLSASYWKEAETREGKWPSQGHIGGKC